jgi:hypothetical protein
MSGDDLVALKNSHGSDKANVNCVSYPRQPNGTFLVPEDVALALLAVPAGFYRATPDEPTFRKHTMIDFLGIPGMNYELGGRKFDADANGIIANVPPGNYGGLLNMGAIPLSPTGWIDPRVAISVDGVKVS